MAAFPDPTMLSTTLLPALIFSLDAALAHILDLHAIEGKLAYGVVNAGPMLEGAIAPFKEQKHPMLSLSAGACCVLAIYKTYFFFVCSSALSM